MKLKRYFKEFHYPSAKAVLDHARRISSEMKLHTNRPRTEAIDSSVLKERVAKILKKSSALPHYAPIYALRGLGHSWGEIGDHFGVDRRAVRFVYDTAHFIATDERKVPTTRLTSIEGKTPTPKPVLGGKPHLERFNTLRAFLQHVDIVSEKIGQQPKVERKTGSGRPLGPLGDFQRRVAELAPRFKTAEGERYDNTKIIEALLGKPKEQINPKEYRRFRIKVVNALLELKKRGIIAQSEQRRAPIFRQATSVDIKKHRKLIFHVLKRGHRFLRRDWPYHLSYDEAVAIGEEGLKKAVERFDETKGYKFSSYAVGWIAGTITRAVKAKSKVPAGQSLDELTRDEIDRHELVAAPEPIDESERTRDALKILFKLHKRNKLPALDLTILALTLHGHTGPEIGKYYEVTRARISQIAQRAKQAVTENIRK